jgi:hypothetical protein
MWMDLLIEGIHPLPGRHVTDHQMRLYMKFRQTDAPPLAAVDRLVHHATIFEMNVESYRRRTAIERKQKGAGRPPSYATINDTTALSRRDNQPET